MVLTSLLAFTFVLPQATGSEWVQLDGPHRPGIQASYDAARGRLVMLGWEGGTWEIEGTTRLNRPNLGTAGEPLSRLRGAMASDSVRGFTLLFGGTPSGTGFAPYLADTWGWDGSAWTPWSGALTPPARIDAVMGFDAARERFVLYGGQGESGLLYDTWEHDAGGWTQVQTENTPSVPRGRMVYDTARGVLVMVSSPGVLNLPMVVNEFDGTDWTRRPDQGAWPLQRSNMSLAYDEGRQVTVMIGGTYYGEEIWEWDGAVWRWVHTLPNPWRIDAPAYFDLGLGKVVVLGGTSNVSGGGVITHTDAHTWDGSSFAQLWPEQGPTTRYDEVLFADPSTGKITLSGGNQAWLTDDAWEWDGNSWTRLQPANSPTRRGNPSSTYDSARGVGLLFGGFFNAAYLDDLWAWDGSDWTELAVTSRPDRRSGAGMAFDSARGVAVMFGGGDGPLYLCCNLRDDTWEWNGQDWRNRTGATKPPARERPALGFDESRGVTVMFGGRTGLTAADQIADTWEWDGEGWREVFPAQSPPALVSPTLTFDPNRGRLVLVGVSITGSVYAHETWDYDGATWNLIDRNLDTVNGGTNAVWDPSRQRITLYDGQTLRALTSTPASALVYGSGCGSSPLPMVRTRARLGEAQFGFEARVAPGQPTLFAIGLSGASTPIGGGCTLLVKPIRWRLVTANGFGIASTVLPLRNDISYVGISIYGQAGVVDAKSASQWGLSAGMCVTLGD